MLPVHTALVAGRTYLFEGLLGSGACQRYQPVRDTHRDASLLSWAAEPTAGAAFLKHEKITKRLYPLRLLTGPC